MTKNPTKKWYSKLAAMPEYHYDPICIENVSAFLSNYINAIILNSARGMPAHADSLLPVVKSALVEKGVKGADSDTKLIEIIIGQNLADPIDNQIKNRWKAACQSLTPLQMEQWRGIALGDTVEACRKVKLDKEATDTIFKILGITTTLQAALIYFTLKPEADRLQNESLAPITPMQIQPPSDTSFRGLVKRNAIEKRRIGFDEMPSISPFDVTPTQGRANDEWLTKMRKLGKIPDNFR